ncbi:hypothetical protein NDU88_002422 [Pleurodeles waltl]|uniref:Uncharacterized protein n=1 Tax=Pleurodeles waltl TaxID=8319 RepID=A0AAV7U992_PLEWA|nr:hypothetical protein NDU88_002422 [Pleurodeles waltl]
MVQALVAGPSSEEALVLLCGTFWERPDHLSLGLPARRQEHNGTPRLRVLRSQATDLDCPSGAAASRKNQLNKSRSTKKITPSDKNQKESAEPAPKKWEEAIRRRVQEQDGNNPMKTDI